LSEPNTIRTHPAPIRPQGDVRAAIARAARATGVDFNYLLAQAKIESSLDPAARAPTSSAAGLYQFTRSTWIDTLDRHGADHGLGWADAAIEGGGLKDPATRAQVMALRNDPDASALMAAELASDNRDALSAQLGRDPDAAELYLAHFLGIGGASRFLSALAADPAQSAAALLPQAAGANRAIFYDGGAPRSVSGVMEVLRAKVSAAMEGGTGLPPPEGQAPAQWAAAGWPPLGGAPASGGTFAGGAPAQSRPSMADTLRATFALGSAAGEASAPAHVRGAYAALRKFGL